MEILFQPSQNGFLFLDNSSSTRLVYALKIVSQCAKVVQQADGSFALEGPHNAQFGWRMENKSNARVRVTTYNGDICLGSVCMSPGSSGFVDRSTDPNNNSIFTILAAGSQSALLAGEAGMNPETKGLFTLVVEPELAIPVYRPHVALNDQYNIPRNGRGDALPNPFEYVDHGPVMGSEPKREPAIIGGTGESKVQFKQDRTPFTPSGEVYHIYLLSKVVGDPLPDVRPLTSGAFVQTPTASTPKPTIRDF